MSKYIMNCENLLYCTSCKEYECAIADDFGYKRRCSDNNNCNLKQIVELCKEIKCPCEFKGADCWECTESGARRLADKILKLLDIQEVE